MVATMFNNITKGLYWSTGKNIEPHATPNVICEKAIKTCINESRSLLVNFKKFVLLAINLLTYH